MSLGACAVIDYVGVLGQVSFHLLIWLLALLWRRCGDNFGSGLFADEGQVDHRRFSIPKTTFKVRYGLALHSPLPHIAKAIPPRRLCCTKSCDNFADPTWNLSTWGLVRVCFPSGNLLVSPFQCGTGTLVFERFCWLLYACAMCSFGKLVVVNHCLPVFFTQILGGFHPILWLLYGCLPKKLHPFLLLLSFVNISPKKLHLFVYITKNQKPKTTNQKKSKN